MKLSSSNLKIKNSDPHKYPMEKVIWRADNLQYNAQGRVIKKNYIHLSQDLFNPNCNESKFTLTMSEQV